MKKVFLFLVATWSMFAATPEQVERYLLVSGSEDQLIEFEQMIDQSSKMFSARSGNDAPLMQDSQMVPIRFREYLQKHLSESEMDEVLDNYKHDVLRKLVSAEVLMEEPDTVEAYRQFLTRIKSDPLPANRTETVKEIVKKLYDEKMLTEFFDKMFMPMMKQISAISGKALTKEQVKQMEKSFIKKMRQSNLNALLFMSRDFSDEELDTLNDIAGNSATSHETRAVFGAIVYAMEEAMHNMADRFAQMMKGRKHPAVAPQAEGNRSVPTKERKN